MTPVNRSDGIRIAQTLKKVWGEDFPQSLQRVYLFGSVARNQAHEDSDIDIAVVCAPFARSKIREASALYASFPNIKNITATTFYLPGTGAKNIGNPCDGTE